MTSAQRKVTLTTEDGHELIADVAEPDQPADVVGGVVVCHPHPLHGGDRFHPIVDALFRILPAAGLRTIRFDFRRDHDGGRGERLDVAAALDAITTDGERGPSGGPLAVVGYSFGAVVSLSTDDDRIGAIVAIAPPLTMMPVPAPSVPTLVLTPRHDQFCPPAAAEPIVGRWPRAQLRVIESADHFMAGHAATAAELTLDWLRSRP